MNIAIGRTEQQETSQRGMALMYGGAGLSVALAIGLWAAGEQQPALFVGLWAPSVLALSMALRGARWLIPPALVSMAASIALWFFVDKAAGQLVGLWVPTILSLAATMKEGNRG